VPLISKDGRGLTDKAGVPMLEQKSGKPYAFFTDVEMSDRSMRKLALALAGAHAVIVSEDGVAVAHHLSQWLCAEAEMICFMLRLRDPTWPLRC
jgi:hypothetical protein